MTSNKICYDPHAYTALIIQKLLLIIVILGVIVVGLMLTPFASHLYYSYGRSHTYIFIPSIVLIIPFIYLGYKYFLLYKELQDNIFSDITCREFLSLIKFLDSLIAVNPSQLSDIFYCGSCVASAIQKLKSVDQVSWQGIIGILELIGLDMDSLKKYSIGRIKRALKSNLVGQYEFQEFTEKIIKRLLSLATRYTSKPIYLALSKPYRPVKVQVTFGTPISIVEPHLQMKAEDIDVEDYLQKLRGVK